MHGMEEGKDALVSGRKKAVWHMAKTDTQIVDGLMTAQEAARLGWKRQDGEEGWWEPILIQSYARASGDQFVTIPGTFAVCRNDFATDDSRRFISTGRGVGAGFQLLDNTTVVDMMSALTQFGAHVDTCGSLFGGQRVYMVALLPGSADIEGDKLEQYLILTTAHDGTACFEGLVTPVRAVCHNTLTLAKGRSTTRIKISHRKNACDRLAQASDLIKIASDSFGETTDILRSLAAIKLPQERAENLLEQIVVGDGTRADKRRDAIMTLFNGKQIGFADCKAVQGTAYGMVSAVSEYIETAMAISVHKNALGVKRDERDVRMNTVLFGAGARLRQKAIDKALALN